MPSVFLRPALDDDLALEDAARPAIEHRFHELAALAAGRGMIDDKREIGVRTPPQNHRACVMAARVRAFEADRGLGAHDRAINGHLQRLVISALGQGYCRRGQMLGRLARSQPDMLHGRARADGKPRVRDGLRLMRSVCFDQRNFGAFADADGVLERIQRGLVRCREI